MTSNHPFRIIDANKFLTTKLSSYMRGRETLQAHIITYGKVKGYQAGRISTCENGLSVTIRTGNLEYTSPSMARLVSDVLSSRLEKPILSHLDGEMAQKRVETAMRDIAVDRSDIAFVYAGVSGFAPAVNYALGLAALLEPGHVCIVTCDCRSLEKEAHLDQVPGMDRIGHVVVTRECGGRNTMRDITNALIEHWPMRVSA